MASPTSEWETHWEHYADSAEWNPAQAYRRRLIRSLLDVTPACKRVVDIGSGQGDLAAELHADFPTAEILGVELSSSGVEIARSKVPSATFVQRDLLQPATPGPDHRDIHGLGSRRRAAQARADNDFPLAPFGNIIIAQQNSQTLRGFRCQLRVGPVHLIDGKLMGDQLRHIDLFVV